MKFVVNTRPLKKTHAPISLNRLSVSLFSLSKEIKTALASKKRTVTKEEFVISDDVFGCAGFGGPKQNPAHHCMAPGRAVKVLLATCPRALLRSTLTLRPCVMVLC